MANIKISELTTGGALGGSEYVPIVQNGATVKTTVQAIADLGGGGGGGFDYDLLIEKAQYSHVAAFDAVTLPTNYSDYTHLIFFGTQDAANQNLIECVMPSVIKYYEDYNEVPNQLLFVIPTADITATDQNIQIPLLNGNKIDFGIWTQAKINDARVLGYNYGWPWQNIWIYCYGVNL